MLALQWVWHALTETDKAIAEIALACGFAHQEHLTPGPSAAGAAKHRRVSARRPRVDHREAATSMHDMILCRTVACFVQDGLAPPS